MPRVGDKHYPYTAKGQAAAKAAAKRTTMESALNAVAALRNAVQAAREIKDRRLGNPGAKSGSPHLILSAP